MLRKTKLSLIIFITLIELGAKPCFAYPYAVMLSGGPAWTDAGNTQTFFLKSDVQNTYHADNKTTTLRTGELFLGYHRPLNTYLHGLWGVTIAGSGTAKPSGEIWQDADSTYNNFDYSYRIYQVRLALKGKLIALQNPWTQIIQPYISGSLGVGWNTAYDYIATPKITEAIPAPAFRDHTRTSFSYTAGIGIQKSLNPNWQVGIGYELADWGSSSLSNAPGQTLNSGLSLGHLYTHELQFSLSYTA
ncbi:outer membrane beta-barrel protein [bacterium]|nr:outer membrane beta-barrel protein [bacterium]